MISYKTKSLFCAFSLFTVSCFAQDLEKLENLSLEELLAVKTDKTCLPIETNPRVAHSDKTINIGMILPISKLSTMGNFIDGAKLAVKEINKSGGVLGKKLNLIVADDGGEALFSMQKAKELIEVYGVKFIIGPSQSSRFMAVSENVVTNQDALLFGANTTAVGISTLDDDGMAFRTLSSDALHSQLATNYLLEKGKKTVGLFYVDNAFGRGHTAGFRSEFEEKGGVVVAEEKFSPLVELESYDLSPQDRESTSSKT